MKLESQYFLNIFGISGNSQIIIYSTEYIEYIEIFRVLNSQRHDMSPKDKIHYQNTQKIHSQKAKNEKKKKFISTERRCNRTEHSV